MDFYARIGFTNNPQFTDETAACMVFSEEIYVMLLTHPKFSFFTEKAIADTHKVAAAILSLSLDSPEQMNQMMEQGLAAGGTEPRPAADYGFMQQRSLTDPDGHSWEVFYMDMSKAPQANNS